MPDLQEQGSFHGNHKVATGKHLSCSGAAPSDDCGRQRAAAAAILALQFHFTRSEACESQSVALSKVTNMPWVCNRPWRDQTHCA